MRDELVKILPKLRRFAFALTGTAHDADDLLQGTVEKLLVKGIPEDIHLEKWAIRVCRNLWIDEVRKQKVRAVVDLDDAQIPINVGDNERHILNSITLAQVNMAMDELPINQRTSLALFTVSGLTYAEIADVLEIPIGTVMSRIARARKTLAVRFNTSSAPETKLPPISQLVSMGGV